MEQIILTDLPREGPDRLVKISTEKEVLGILRINGEHYIWQADLFAIHKIGKKTALNRRK